MNKSKTDIGENNSGLTMNRTVNVGGYPLYRSEETTWKETNLQSWREKHKYIKQKDKEYIYKTNT